MVARPGYWEFRENRGLSLCIPSGGYNEPRRFAMSGEPQMAFTKLAIQTMEIES
jgi:hypothetical protein